MTPDLTPRSPAVLTARNAVVATFALNGFLAASLVSRVPDLRSGLRLSNGGLGILLLMIAAGSVLALPAAGWLIERSTVTTVIRASAVACLVGQAAAGVGSGAGALVLAGAGLFVYGAGTSVWDVAMNVEGTEVERLLQRSILPRFHGVWSIGSFAGAGVGVAMAAGHVPLIVHLGAAGVVVVVLAITGARRFLPARAEPETTGPAVRTAWLEPRTLALGVMLLCFAVVEGSANDWLSLALIDGYSVPHWVGVAGYSVFTVCMVAGRFLGPVLLDRYGRAPVLWATSITAGAGIVLVVFGAVLPVIVLGIVAWGLGAALGFPVGMSAAADDPARAAARVSVVATLGYAAFLAGPPLLGFLGDHVGTLDALLAVAALMVPAAVTVLATRPTRAPSGDRTEQRSAART